MKQEITKFICDECGMEAEVKQTNSKVTYPYNDGWCYLYAFNGKFMISNKIEQMEKKDKHFHSKECMLKFVARLLTKGDKSESNEAEDIIEKMQEI